MPSRPGAFMTPGTTKKARRLLTATIAFAAIIGGCGQSDPTGHRSILRLAVTTSTRDSGLLDVLVPVFEREHGITVLVIAVGTGKALKLGEAGDVDAVLVHSRPAEDVFLAAGHAVRREDIMFNRFEILGPPTDPAGIQGMPPIAALRRIASREQRFVSRGDNSGTHQRELRLWGSAGSRPPTQAYIESGQGMGATLIMADQMQAYVLTDRGTYLRFKKKINLKPLVANSQEMTNPYGIMIVDPAKHPDINDRAARAFVDFIISKRAQLIIKNYRIESEPLFHPLHLSQKVLTR